MLYTLRYGFDLLRCGAITVRRAKHLSSNVLPQGCKVNLAFGSVSWQQT
jgi:hypothetical protein